MDSCFKPQHHNSIKIDWKLPVSRVFWLASDFGARTGYAYIHNSVLYFGCYQFVGLDSTGIVATVKKARFTRLIIMSAHDTYGSYTIVRGLAVKKGYLMGRLMSVLPYQKHIEMWFYDQKLSSKNSAKLFAHIKKQKTKKVIHMCEHTYDALEIFSNAFNGTKNKVLSFKVRGILKR